MSNCNVCGSAIGGINYNLAAGNQPETEYVWHWEISEL